MPTKHENPLGRPLKAQTLHPLTHRPQETPLRWFISHSDKHLYLYKGKTQNTPLKTPNRAIYPLSRPLTIRNTHYRPLCTLWFEPLTESFTTILSGAAVPESELLYSIDLKFYTLPHRGTQKIRGRSPVPPAGSIIEPHTDIFPDIVLSSSAPRNLSCKIFPDTPGGCFFCYGLGTLFGTMWGM